MAWGEERQVVPLQYELGGLFLGTAELELKPTAPRGVKLPPLKEPLFFSWKFVDGKRLFVLAKEGKEFVLYVDTDGDNDLTDEQPFRLQLGWGNVLGPIPITLRFNDQTIIRNFFVIVNTKGEIPVLTLQSADQWTGMLLWEGKPMTVVVKDADCDGLIGKGDWLQLGDHSLLAVGKIGINGRFFRHRVEPTGKELILEPMQVQTADLRFQGERLGISVERKNERWWLEGEGGELKAPIGSFYLLKVDIYRKDTKGRLWNLSATSFGEPPNLRILKQGTTLNLEPLRINLQWDEEGDKLIFSLDITTANGMDVVMLLVNEKRPPAPKLRLTTPDGKVIAERQFHYG
ncbi:hypothetical protein [Fervidibacter sacchari]